MLLENKFQNFNLSFIVNEGTNSNFDEVLNKLYYNVLHNNDSDTGTALEKEKQVLNRDYSKVKSIIFESIRYKHIAGIRLEVKGRLTKRYTASRSQHKVRYKGNLVNVYSSIKGYPSSVLRGNLKPNLQYTKLNSKSRIGSFGVKGWVSGI